MSENDGLLNPVVETILNRTSVRCYKKEQILPEQLDLILETALYAPTGGNHQYTRFLAVQDQQTLDAINRIVREEFAAQELDERKYNNKTAVKARHKGYNCMFHAPTLIIVTAPREHPNSMADSANALQNMQIAAASMALGACWVNQLHWLTANERMRTCLYGLGMKTDEEVFGSLAVGISGDRSEGTKPVRPARKAGRIVRI